jgi:hypothetical protein
MWKVASMINKDHNMKMYGWVEIYSILNLDTRWRSLVNFHWIGGPQGWTGLWKRENSFAPVGSRTLILQSWAARSLVTTLIEQYQFFFVVQNSSLSLSRNASHCIPVEMELTLVASSCCWLSVVLLVLWLKNLCTFSVCFKCNEWNL